MPLRSPPARGDLGLRCFYGVEYFPGSIKKNLAFCRQREPSGRAIEKAHAEARFQPRDQLGDCGGGQPKVASRGGKASAVNNTRENAHLVRGISHSRIYFMSGARLSPIINCS